MANCQICCSILVGFLLASALIIAAISSDRGGRQRIIRWLSRFKQFRQLSKEQQQQQNMPIHVNETLEIEATHLRRVVSSLRDELSSIEMQSKRLSNSLSELQKNSKSSSSLLRNSNATNGTANNKRDNAVENVRLRRELEKLMDVDRLYERQIKEFEDLLSSKSKSLSKPLLELTSVPIRPINSQHVVRSTLPPFIFAITTGRTGTRLLQQVLSSAKNVRCFHERHPLMSHSYLRRRYEETYHERMAVKAGALAAAVAEWRWPVASAYCDTSNYFIKSWWDVAMDAFVDERPIIVVVLRRHMASVVKSMVDLNWFGGKGRECGSFLYSVNSNISIIRPLQPDVEMDHFDKAIGHVFDVEAKAMMFRERYAGHVNVRIVEACLEQIIAAPAQFLTLLGLEPTARSDTVIDDAETNERSDKKRSNLTSSTFLVDTRMAIRRTDDNTNAVEYVEQRIAAYRARYAAAGAWLPPSPALDRSFCLRPLAAASSSSSSH